MSRAHEPPKDPDWLRDVEHGRVLAFAPHPDDEVFGPGGCLCLHRRAGDPVRVVVATDGSAGDPDGKYERAEYTALRRRESAAGLAVLGVDDVTFWGFPDSCVLSDQDLELGTQRACDELIRFAPRIVYLPWKLEGHPDHHALHLVVTAALERTGYTGRAFGYEVWQAMVPDVIVDVSPVIEEKKRAMRAHASQLAYGSFDHAMLGLNAYRSLIHARGRGYGEALQIVR